jgi:branched-chain amino acid transport system permease protein
MADLLFLYTSIATLFGIYAILALSFNLEYGYAGQPNLGKVFFFSIGAYVAGILVAHGIAALSGYVGDLFTARAANDRLLYATANPGVILSVFVAALGLAAVAGAGFGILASYPALRLRGDFLAIVLIAVGEAGRVFARVYTPLAGGNIGIGGVPNPFVFLGDRVARVSFSVLVLGIAFAALVLSERLSNSPFGRKLKSVRDDELASSVLGKKTPWTKAQVLAVGSGLAAVAGVLWAFWFQTVAADDFIPQLTFLVVAMVLLGGAANHRGVLLGAITMTLLDHVTRPSFYAILGFEVSLPFDINYLRYIVIGLMIILILMFRPGGLIPEKPVRTPALDVARASQRPSATTEEAPPTDGTTPS